MAVSIETSKDDHIQLAITGHLETIHCRDLIVEMVSFEKSVEEGNFIGPREHLQ